MKDSNKESFEQLGNERQLSFVEEFYYFIVQNKKWWLIPMIVALGLVGLLVALSSSGAAPFIYTFF